MNSKDIRELFRRELNQKVISITDKSKGCDQNVKIVKTEMDIYVFKEPHTEKDKISKEIIATNLCRKKKIPVPEVIYSNENILIETFIEGTDLDEVKTTRDNFEQIYINIGELMRRMHTIKGKGYGPVIKNKLEGTFKTNKEFVDSWFTKEFARLKETKYYSKETIKKMEQYYNNNSKLLKSKESVLIHADLADSNIVLNKNEVSGFIDFGDLLAAPAMLEFAYMYMNHYDEYKFDKLVEGYGKVNMKEIQFYTFFYMVWLLASRIRDKRFDKKFHRMDKLMRKIIN